MTHAAPTIPVHPIAVHPWPSASARLPAPAFGLARKFLGERLSAGDAIKAAKCAAAMVLRPAATRSWLTKLGAIADRLDAPVPFDLVKKIYVPFASRRLGVEQRAALLADHYRIMNRMAGPTMSKALWRGERLTMAELSGKTGCYVVTLARPFHFKNEGEMTFILHPEGRPDRPLANLSVTIGAIDDRSPARVWIGGLQGFRGGKGHVVKATRDLGGLRPKTVLMEAVWALTHALAHRGMAPESMIAASNVTHPLGRDARRPDYDAFWAECGGVQKSCGDFSLPAWAPLEPAGLSGKRAARWRSRLQVREHLREGLFQWVQWPTPRVVVDNGQRRATGADIWGPARLRQA